jgi:hypothetical protein
MLLTDAELAWLDRRAEMICRERAMALVNARPAAMAELVRLIKRPKAGVIDLERRRRHSGAG